MCDKFSGVRGHPASQHRPLFTPCPALVDEPGHSPKMALTDEPCLHVRMQLFAPGIVQAARQEKREKSPDGHPAIRAAEGNLSNIASSTA